MTHWIWILLQRHLSSVWFPFLSCCVTKHCKTLWLKIPMYFLFFLWVYELPGLRWILFSRRPMLCHSVCAGRLLKAQVARPLWRFAYTLAGDAGSWLAAKLGLLNGVLGSAWASHNTGSGFWAGMFQEQVSQDARRGCCQSSSELCLHLAHVMSAGPTVMSFISCWDVTRSGCRKACEMGEIFAANSGNFNMT